MRLEARSMLSAQGGRVAIPHMDQYFGLWMHEPGRLAAMVDLVRGMDLAAHAAQGAPLVRAACTDVLLEGGIDAQWDRQTRTLRAGNVAIIDLDGTLTKYGSSLSDGGSMVRARRDLARAARNETIDAILLRIDSPGGTVAGTGDLAAEIAAVNRVKPVVAYIEDLGASAAYYLASQAGRVLMNPTGAAGSIGVFMLVYDMSGAAAQQGVKAVLVKAGQFKGAGAPGTEMTQAQRAEWQRLVDESYEAFVGAVARGRGMTDEQAREWADGRVWGAADAQAKGLIDGVATLPEALEAAREERVSRMLRGGAEKFSKAGADQPGRHIKQEEGTEMSFLNSIKAVLEGKPESAQAEHLEIAQSAVQTVRAHDKAGHEAAVKEALEQGRAQGAREAGEQATAAALAAERERAAGVVDLCAKAGLSAEQTAAHIKGGQDVGAIAQAVINQCATAQAGIPAKADHVATQPSITDDVQANDQALLANARARAGR